MDTVIEPCKVPGAADKGICAYAGPDGRDACADKCIYLLRARSRTMTAHQVELYPDNNGYDGVFPFCSCGWAADRVRTYDEAAEAYARHRLENNQPIEIDLGMEVMPPIAEFNPRLRCLVDEMRTHTFAEIREVLDALGYLL